MNIISLTAMAIMLFVCGCADIGQERPVKTLSPHDQLAIQLNGRRPDVDAATFYQSGGTGYIQSIGGVRFPIGLDNHRPEYNLDFKTLKRFAPHLYSQISFLYCDPSGDLTWGDMMSTLPSDRLRYYDARAYYATKFNRAMAKLQSKKPSRDS